MGFTRAKFKVSGDKDSIEGVAIVDTGSSMSIIDEKSAKRLGLRHTERTIKLTTLSGEDVVCSEMLVNVLEVEGERLVSERVAVCDLPDKITEKLSALGAHPHPIIGVVTLEAAGFAVNPLTGRLEMVGWLTL